MDSKKCSACERKIKKRSNERQSYCSANKCQRERRRRWQKEKRKSDPDYRDNQSRAHQSWLGRNPNYWKEYRLRRSEYTEKNREQQRIRRQKSKIRPVAKMDSPEDKSHDLSGTYLLIPLSADGVAKMDAWKVEIRFISDAYVHQKNKRQ